MKDEKELTEQNGENDPRRFAYMIAWRDKYIEALQEQLAGWEEKGDLLSSLLYCALFRVASEADAPNEREVLIQKSELTALLGTFECHASDAGDAYAVRFTQKQESVQESTAGEHADGGKAEKS